MTRNQNDPASQTLRDLIKRLVAAGEDAGELDIWLRMFLHMDDEERRELLGSLQKEAEDLEKIKQQQ